MGVVTRSVHTDNAGVENGRFALAGTATFSTVAVSVLVSWTAPGETEAAREGVVIRYVDSNNWLVGFVGLDGASHRTLETYKRVGGGAATLVDSTPFSGSGAASEQVFELSAKSDGSWVASCAGAGLVGQDPVLATGGALASGKVGLYDWGGTASD